MSELTDQIKDFEKLLKQKGILTAQVDEMTRQCEQLTEEHRNLNSMLTAIHVGIHKKEEESNERIKEYNDAQGAVVGKELKRLQALEKKTNQLCQDEADTARLQKQRDNELAAREQARIEERSELDKRQTDLNAQEERLKIQQDEVSVQLGQTTSKLRKIEQLKKETEELIQDANDAKKHNRNNRLKNEKRVEELDAYKQELDGIKIESENYLEKISEKEADLQKKWAEYNEVKAIVDKRAKDTQDLKRGLEAEKTELAFQLAKVKGKK